MVHYEDDNVYRERIYEHPIPYSNVYRERIYEHPIPYSEETLKKSAVVILCIMAVVLVILWLVS